jgi:hypothetical protein
MKTLMTTVMAFTLILGATLTSCEPPVEGLSQEEQNALVFMLEEEKVARDVYYTLSQTWNIGQLNNIPASEQMHMDAIAQILDDHSITYEILDYGVFNNTDLQELYNALLAKGLPSEIDALQVGAMVEDLDLVDLENFMNQTTNGKMLQVYDMLQCGSRNHLRAFMMGLDSRGGTYTPQYLSQEEFDAILAGSHEDCGV